MLLINEVRRWMTPLHNSLPVLRPLQADENGIACVARCVPTVWNNPRARGLNLAWSGTGCWHRKGGKMKQGKGVPIPKKKKKTSLEFHYYSSASGTGIRSWTLGRQISALKEASYGRTRNTHSLKVYCSLQPQNRISIRSEIGVALAHTRHATLQCLSSSYKFHFFSKFSLLSFWRVKANFQLVL